jgi:hypothetical protein
MKRSAPKRRKALARSRAPLPRRKGRIKSRGKPRFKVSGKRDEVFRAWIRDQACCVSKVSTGELAWRTMDEDFSGTTVREHYAFIDAAHVRARGAGGMDHGNLVPLEHRLHMEQHRIGQRSFEGKYGVDLRALAADYESRWRAAQPEAAW